MVRVVEALIVLWVVMLGAALLLPPPEVNWDEDTEWPDDGYPEE